MIAGDTVFGRFDEGDGEYDPTLIWSVDLRCEGPGVPRNRQAARKWLLDCGESITAGFRKIADELTVGVDVDFYPLEWSQFDDVPAGVRMKVVCSIQRRLEATVLAQALLKIADGWRPTIDSLSSPQSSSV